MSRNPTEIRKRRGVVRRSITNLSKRLTELEAKEDRSDIRNHAQLLLTRLRALSSEFKTFQYELMAAIDETDADTIDREQDALDSHDEEFDQLCLRIQQLLAAEDSNNTSRASNSESSSVLRTLTFLKESLNSVDEGISSQLTLESPDLALCQQYQEELSDVKSELAICRDRALRMESEESERLLERCSTLKRLHFDCSCKIKRIVNSQDTHHPVGSEQRALKIPKLEAPTFNGDILNWTHFWEQFDISVHSQSNLSDAEKFVYLQHSLKGGSAKSVIEGLSGTGEHYNKAIECLRARYDQPRLIHQSHVKAILETPSLQDGSGKHLRRLHDTLLQHLRALDAADCEPLSRFITSIIQLKLDPNTLFEWQKHTQTATSVPSFERLLEFIDLRARASESATGRSPKGTGTPKKPIIAFPANVETSSSYCIVCKRESHPLYHCTKFKDMSHDRKTTVVKSNNLCMNCLKPGHFLKECKSSHFCRHCQKPHHTLLHIDVQEHNPMTAVSSNTSVGTIPDTLLMTCQVLVTAPDGTTIKVRALLDSASSSSFISERLAQNICISRSYHKVTISGVAGLTSTSPRRPITTVKISPVASPDRQLTITAVIVPRVTCDLPLGPVSFSKDWTHLDDITLADPNFGCPGRIDLLLGVDVYADSVLQGRRYGPPGSPVAFKTIFGWVLVGRTHSKSISLVTTHHTFIDSDTNDVIRQFWEIEEVPSPEDSLSLEEKEALIHFKETYQQNSEGRFIVSLPRRSGVKPLGESRSQAVRRFFFLERSLLKKGQHKQFDQVMKEYLELGHAEAVPINDLTNPPPEIFYLPMHAVYKYSSTTTKIRAVFDASAKSTTGVSLNDCLLVGPTVHAPLIDVLLRFRSYKIAITTDVSKMYRAIELTNSDRDLHRFIWRSNPSDIIQDYRMTRVTFGVSASSFIANMCVKQNAYNLAHKFPLAAEAVYKSFYVDDGLTGADDLTTAIRLQSELQELFAQGGFKLHKWNSNHPSVIQHINVECRDVSDSHQIVEVGEKVKTLGLEWKTDTDQFHLTISQSPPRENLTKRLLTSDIARTFDILGWFAPAIIKVKILLQRLWEEGIDWDDPAPPNIQDIWRRWRDELPCLLCKHIPRYYYPKDVPVVSKSLHGFSDASEDAYSAVVYLRIVDANADVHITLVTSKTKVAPIKRLTIPRLELCGAVLLSKLLTHVKNIFDLPLSDVNGWTDSTIVLSWLSGNPRRFVGNRVSQIISRIPSERWSHVSGVDNPADCASRGLFPSELVQHHVWWSGPPWLSSPPWKWPNQPSSTNHDEISDEINESYIVTHTTTVPLTKSSCVVSIDRYSSFDRIRRIIAWIIRFTHNCQPLKFNCHQSPHLTTSELTLAEIHLYATVQADHFSREIDHIKSNCPLPNGSCLLPLAPFLDSSGLLRVGGRQAHSTLSYCQTHPVLLHAKHRITKLFIQSEDKRLLHAGPTLMISSLSRRLYIIRVRSAVRAVTRQCVICRRSSIKPKPPHFGQLPLERLTPGPIFERTGLDYAGPLYIKYGYIRKPTVIKAYVCVFVSLTVKAVHLELITDLTSEAFLACLRRFVSRRGYPSLLWSDHGSNFVGANRELKEIMNFLKLQITQKNVSEFCSAKSVEWKFIPQRSPHFGGLWEAAVKSFKTHLKRIVGDVRLTYEEMSTVLAQIEACLNSRPLVALNSLDDDSIEVLTPGHFLIGQPLVTLPDPALSYRSVSLLKRWHLCQNLVRHFWKRWSLEYLTTLQRFYKWRHPTKNLSVGDLVLLIENEVIPTRWPLARVAKIFPGNDGVVRVVDIETSKGSYRRPVHKLAPLLSNEDEGYDSQT